MSRFKTPKGTELPLLDLRGKPYLQVAHRLVWFREEHADWTIETELIQSTDQLSVTRAMIKDASGKIMATAHKQETRQGFADHLEKSETGAVGRALAMCGYGTQFAPELDEEDRIVDAPTQRSRVQPPQPPAETHQKLDIDPAQYVVKFGKHRNKKLAAIGPKDVQSYMNWMRDSKNNKDGGGMTPEAKEFLEFGEKFLAQANAH